MAQTMKYQCRARAECAAQTMRCRCRARAEESVHVPLKMSAKNVGGFSGRKQRGRVQLKDVAAERTAQTTG